MRLGFRLLLGVFLIVGMAAYVGLSTFSREVKPGVRQGMEVALVDTANLLAELAAQDMARGTLVQGRLAQAFRNYQARDVRARIGWMTKTGAGLRLYVTDAEGIVRFDSDGDAVGQDYSRWNDVALTLRGQYGARVTRLDPGNPGTAAMHVAAPVRREGRIVGVLTVVAPTVLVQPFAQRSEHRIRVAGAILVAASLGIGLVLTWWLTRDVTRLQAYARDVGVDGKTPLPALGAPELRELGAALEAMRARIDGRDYVEHYIHTLTHEMKSPLSAIRGAAELLSEDLPEADRARFTGNILEQEKRMRELVERMLTLASLRHRQQLQTPAPVEPGPLARKVAASRQEEAARLGVELRVGPDRPAPVTGEAFLLEQALGNLLDNALSFAPRGSAVEVTLETGPDTLVMAVRDRGPGLPGFALEKVFTPFFSLPRPAGGSRGTGLGLCFVKEVALLHGGTASLENHPEGGAVARITLPR